MDKFNKKIELINLHNHYKVLADIQAERGNFEEAKAYDDLAHGIDLAILDLMVDEQNVRIKLAIVA
jgi:hypothetical protein